MDSSSAIALAALVVSVPSALVTIWYSHKQTQAAARANALTEQVRREQAEPFVTLGAEKAAILNQAV
jgi:hypothetical protein